MMAPSAAQSLNRWIPRLLAVWRASRRVKAKPEHARGGRALELPENRLTRDELRDVAGAVQKLSHGLTRDRTLAGAKYMDDERLLGAYLLFYWPISYLQARALLSELPGRPRAALDLGSGPAPVAFAALDAGAAEVTACDRSNQALEMARKLAAHAEESLFTDHWDPAAGPSTPRSLRERSAQDARRVFDLVTMGHVLNELWKGPEAIAKRADLCEQMLELVRPGGTLLIIEPALRDTSRALLQVRDVLVGRGFAVRAPCLFRGDCPALIKESDWCHAERAIEPPPLIAEIARAAGLRKEALKMSYLALAPRGEAWAEPPVGKVFRIVSEPLPSKGRLRYMGCGPDGRVGLALQEKHVAESNRGFAKLNRGDVIRVSETEPRGDGLALGERSTVDVVARAGALVPGGTGESS